VIRHRTNHDAAQPDDDTRRQQLTQQFCAVTQVTPVVDDAERDQNRRSEQKRRPGGRPDGTIEGRDGRHAGGNRDPADARDG